MKKITIISLLGVIITTFCFSQTSYPVTAIASKDKSQTNTYKTEGGQYETQQISLSVQQCREMALENSEDMKIARYRNEQARIEKRIAQIAGLPKFSASGTYAYMNSDIDIGLPEMDLKIPIMGNEVDLSDMIPETINMGTNTDIYMIGANVQQPIYAGGRIITGNKMAEKGIEITEENKIMMRMSVIAEAEKAYWTYFSVNDKINLLRQYEALLDTLHQSVSDMVSVKMATENDLLKITSRKSNIRYQMQKAVNGMELSRMELCRIIGVDLDTKIILTDSVPKEDSQRPDYSYDLSMRPEYRMLQKQVELKELNIKNVRGDYLPTVGLMAGYSYLGKIDLGGISMRMNRPSASVILSVSVPIFNFGEGSKKIENARKARDIQLEEFNKTGKQLTIEIQHAERNLQDATLLINTAETALEQAKANLRSVRDNYEVGMGTLLDVLDAQTQWQEAYSNMIDARVQYKISEVEFLRVTGRL
ncbi:TolC family protein [Proteiniphilum sp.]|uniref:TolC family protein n=1 Tax=Proteiniphilum sp. TaxID=1926877 RepID=UPI002B1F695C|nr:TolC family protein [Proteiniphilum sp.]MEA4918575.1 TolC family protein [Proteiniphilum sp.]